MSKTAGVGGGGHPEKLDVRPFRSRHGGSFWHLPWFWGDPGSDPGWPVIRPLPAHTDAIIPPRLGETGLMCKQVSFSANSTTPQSGRQQK